MRKRRHGGVNRKRAQCAGAACSAVVVYGVRVAVWWSYVRVSAEAESVMQ